MKISFENMQKEIERVLIKSGLSKQSAFLCAKVHSESSLDGVYSHGLNRVKKFCDFVKNGWINIESEKPSLIKKTGCMENYDGNMGIGIISALFSADRAAELAKEHAIGVVSLRNTNHWMRGGTYAWEIANKGFIGICFTNTESCMPVWGAKNLNMGNNPLVIGIPYSKGNIVVDMAMSLYSYGKLQVTRLKGEKLPYPGGYDENGNLTDEPSIIEKTRRLLPVGYWKGSSLSIALDLLAAILSNGLPTVEIDKIKKGSCSGCSQIFMAINPYAFEDKEKAEKTIEETIKHIHDGVPAEEGINIYYPGERTKAIREKQLKEGIEVDESVWRELLSI